MGGFQLFVVICRPGLPNGKDPEGREGREALEGREASLAWSDVHGSDRN